jgi:hypothetical protein
MAEKRKRLSRGTTFPDFPRYLPTAKAIELRKRRHRENKVPVPAPFPGYYRTGVGITPGN